jgi:hypothetical protein
LLILFYILLRLLLVWKVLAIAFVDDLVHVNSNTVYDIKLTIFLSIL